MNHKALILIDIQNDFLPGGALPVPKGDSIFPAVNRLLRLPFAFRIATKDWHPLHHKSFAVEHQKRPGEFIELGGVQQILWPVHCVQETEGAAFASGWESGRIDEVFLKGSDSEIDSYSAFFDNARRHKTGLEEFLRKKGIATLFFGGLATDYCVSYSVLDALSLGFETYLVTDACCGIDSQPGDVEKALKEIEKRGGQLVTVEAVERLLTYNPCP